MTRLWLIVLGLVLANGGLLLVRPKASLEWDPHARPRVGIVFDVGGRGDKSFNDGAYDGAMRAKNELGASVKLIEPGEGSDREAGLRLLASEGVELVVGVGFIFSDDLVALAKEYPNVAFAGIDFAEPALPRDASGKQLTLPNLAALKFREEEGSFLVGAIAGLVSKSKVVGFVGGMDTALIHKFEAGYRAGVRAVCATCRVIPKYAGVTPEAFRNPSKGKELALSQIQQGADIIYQAAGSTGLGVFEAARAAKKLAIGTDADQSHEAPGTILTSMVKGIDTVVFEASKRVKDGTFKGGVYSFGLKEKGVGYVYNERNKDLLPAEVKVRVDRLAEEIIAGKIVVPSTREALRASGPGAPEGR